MTINSKPTTLKSSLPLNRGWTVRELARPGVPTHMLLSELPAKAPGYVHLDLIRNGVIDDPFKDLSEKSLGWIDETDWEYRTTFHVSERLPGKNLLVFDGIDTVADISLNGALLASVDNMHRMYEFEVGDRLRCGDGSLGDNELIVTIRSATRIGRERQAAWNAAGEPTLPEHWDNWAARSFVRKAQYMFGWDWGPVLPSAGIWRDVELANIPVARIIGWKHDVTFEETDGAEKAIIDIEVQVERSPGQETTPLALSILRNERQGFDNIHESTRSPAVAVLGGAGISTVNLQLVIDSPRRWWPREYGEQHLYTIVTALSTASEDIDTIGKRIGLRTIELVRTPDADGNGEGFKFRVNGVYIFMKGANWIPAESFPSDDDRKLLSQFGKFDATRKLIGDAAAGGMNMLRVWGGGFYESSAFYNRCDELGILVWQDFLFGCAYYPDNDAFCEEVRLEAVENVRRIRHHASIALWCGNNENQVLHHDGWAGTRPPRFLGERLYEDVLPSVVAAEDPNTPYWPGSPYGAARPGDSPNSPDYGDRHNWDVWHGIGDWTNYAKDNSRFVSEFGFASSCGMQSWEKYISEDQRSPYSPAVRWHDKTRKGYETYLGMVGIHFPKPQSLEDLVYYTQLNQAEALKFGIEHYRRNKGRCWGTLFWQINDCWPVQSWAVIDYLGEPKAAYWAMRKFYAPVLVSLVRHGASVAVHMVSDRVTPTYGTLTITLQHFDGSVIRRSESEVELGANVSAQVASFDISDADDLLREVVVRADFVAGDSARVENALLLAEPKDLRVTDPGLDWRLERMDDHRGLVLHLHADRFAPYVWIRRNDNKSVTKPLDGADNFFHLFPGETKAVRLIGKLDEVRRRLSVRWL